MARAKPTEAAAPSTTLVAAAQRIDRKVARIYIKDGLEWQREAYRHYTICGEARFAARFMGNALSRAVLSIEDVAGKAVTTGPAVDALDSLFDGKVGQADMLDAIGTHLTIAGECYLIGRRVDGKDVWEIVSVLEIDVQGKVWTIKYNNPTYPDVVLADSDVAIRIWIPLPGRKMTADSPFRALLPVLTEIEWATRHIFAQMSSRLAGAGILFLPQSMTFPPPPDQEGEQAETTNEATAFLKLLADVASATIKNPELPSALVPITVTAPADAIDKARLMQFWTDLDEKALSIRTDAVGRFANGMDMPKEQVLGMSSNSGTGGGSSNGVSHWGAWQIEEATIKMHIEPMLDVVIAALTLKFLRPLLGPGVLDRIVASTAALRLRPDRSKESIELYNLGLLKGEVVVVENGFDPADMPDDKELVFWLLKKVAGGSATPEQVGYALRELGVAIPEPAQEAPKAIEQPRESRPDPSLEDHPTRPRTPDESALIYACDAMVWRALELAGKRAINAGLRGKNRDRTIEPTKFHLEAEVAASPAFLLEGGFAYGPQVLGEQWDAVRQALWDYCAVLIQTQTEHTREHLGEFLTHRGLLVAGAEKATPPPLNLTVNIGGTKHDFTLALPEGMIATPEVKLSPTFEMNPTFDMTAPEVSVELNPTFDIAGAEVTLNPTFEVSSPQVVNNIDVNPTPVTVENNIDVKPTPVNVAAPTVNVTPKVEVKTAEAKTPPEKKRKTRVLRDADGTITGTEEV